MVRNYIILMVYAIIYFNCNILYAETKPDNQLISSDKPGFVSLFEDANTGLVMVDGKLIEKPVLRQMQRTVEISNKLKSSR